MLGPWILAGVGLWLAFDNGPALLHELRLRGSAERGTATVLSIDGGRPTRILSRLWDDFLWGRGRRVTYRFTVRDDLPTRAAAFVTHDAADVLREGGSVAVRYLAADPSVHRIDGEPGIVLLSFRFLLAAGLVALCIAWLVGRRARSEGRSASTEVLA
jgi:hypothetical protein